MTARDMNNPGQETLNKCIMQIYDAALDPSSWNSFLQTVSREVNGTMGLLIFGNSGSHPDNFFIHNNVSEDCLAVYKEHYFLENDLYYQVIKKHHLAGKAFIGSEYISDSFLKKSAMYHDFLQPSEAGYFLCAPVVATRSETFGLAIHRPMHRDNFNNQHKRFIGTLMPHLLCAFQIHECCAQNVQERESAYEALHLMETATILVDELGEVRFLNRAAERFLQDNDGLCYKSKKIFLNESKKQSELNHLLSAATLTAYGKGPGAGGEMLVYRPSDGCALRIIVSPLNPGSRYQLPGSRPGACVFIHGPGKRQQLSQEILRRIYKLTPTEINVIRLFFAGENPDAISKSLKIKITTARTHLYNIMEKTGTRSQIELMRLLSDGHYQYGPGD